MFLKTVWVIYILQVIFKNEPCLNANDLRRFEVSFLLFSLRTRKGLSLGWFDRYIIIPLFIFFYIEFIRIFSTFIVIIAYFTFIVRFRSNGRFVLLHELIAGNWRILDACIRALGWKYHLEVRRLIVAVSAFI